MLLEKFIFNTRPTQTMSYCNDRFARFFYYSHKLYAITVLFVSVCDENRFFSTVFVSENSMVPDVDNAYYKECVTTLRDGCRNDNTKAERGYNHTKDRGTKIT